ncbi:hypothetical protein TSUD_47480 [Trifolium subterraneum]|nr:hypothetical protein TSUD_47480 [Trifolium subterraneum]
MDQDEKQKDKRIIFFELENGAVKKFFANHSGIGVLLIGVAFLLMRVGYTENLNSPFYHFTNALT